MTLPWLLVLLCAVGVVPLSRLLLQMAPSAAAQADRFDRLVALASALVMVGFLLLLIMVGGPGLWTLVQGGPLSTTHAWLILRDTLLMAAGAAIFAGLVGAIVAYALNVAIPAMLAGRLRRIFQVLQAVPAVLFGVFAYLVVLPVVERLTEGALWQSLHLVAWMDIWPDRGAAWLTAILSIGLMLASFVAARLDGALRDVSPSYSDAGYAAGLTRFEVFTNVQWPLIKGEVTMTGVAVMNRALGETTILVLILAYLFQMPILEEPRLHLATVEILIALHGSGAHGQGGGLSTALVLSTILLGFTLATNQWAWRMRGSQPSRLT
jgi:phosphate transport system permease protein